MANEPKYIPNTNIPISVLEGLKDDDPDKWNRILDRLQSEIQNGDTKAINDALFDVAFYTMMGDGTGNKPGNVEWGLGQGNANVSKIHDGSWTINSNVEPVDWTAWAANYINSPNDVYNQDDDTVVTWDDKLGVLHDGVSIGSWGGNDRGQPPPPKGVRGKPPTNPVISGPGGDTNLKNIWPDIDWDTQGDTDLEQYDYWETQNIGDGTDLGQYGPTVTKGLFGFSGERPEADFAKHPYNYLNAYGIGHNLAYKPWHTASWRGPDEENFYRGIPGGEKTRDQLYHYGGSRANQVLRDKDGKAIIDEETGKAKRGTLLQPMQVPGGWKTATLPEGSQSYYPIARTPLFPSGLISPQGAVAPYVKPKDKDDGGKKKKPADGDNGGAGAGKKLAFYEGRAGAFGGTDTGGNNLMFQVTSEPTEKYIGDGKTSWGNMGVDLWQNGTLFQTTAYRAMKGKDWTDADNSWVLRRTGEMGSGEDEGGLNLPNIKFADWSDGVSSNKIYGATPTLDFLGKPQNVQMRDPDHPAGPMLNVAYTLPTSYGKSYSTGGFENYPDSASLASILASTTPTQPWAHLPGMKTAGFPDRYGGKWVLPGIYGQERNTGVTTSNLLGYGLPQFLADEYFNTGADFEWGRDYGVNPSEGGGGLS